MSDRKKGMSPALRVCLLALLSAVAVVVGLFRFPIFPSAPWLEFDFADTPIIIGSMIFGPLPGLAVLFVVSAVQAFFLGGNGIIGMIMHFCASGTMLLIISAIAGRTGRKLPAKRRSGGKPVRLIIALVCGALARTAVMIPMNYIFTPLLFGADRALVTSLLPVIIPFNLIMAGGNCVIAAIVFGLLRPFLEKQGLLSRREDKD